ncbi:hypothetical protein NLX71_14880 [Paenibacillus sp. MZ04-78.2]|uniref:glycan biosynthesis hexose transferase WsfD n=1 Tax=Paenibacillus sp. MZ04-78.2 TaxID=2962034 RepID=UPI0020B6CE1E|nr:hypothetical protein [Paenibacillus sp. MZ04-78.2]MCP3774576.1 hypothetical protein [Paenibacillus sp. MZ04-78.2]
MAIIQRYFNAIIISLVAAILGLKILVAPVIGLANNGDFVRIMEDAELKYLSKDAEDMYFNYVNRTFSISPQLPITTEKYFSSTNLFVKASVWINKLFVNDTYDIRILGAIHLILFLLSFYILLRLLSYTKYKYISAILFFLIYCDIGYFSYFNSFYSETTSFIFFIFTILFFLKIINDSKYSYLNFLFFFISSSLFITAKSQNSPLGFLISIYLIRLIWNYRQRLKQFLLLLMSILTLGISILVYNNTSGTVMQINKYDSIFSSLIKYSEHPEEDLKKLGMDPKYALLKNTAWFSKNKPMELEEEFFKQLEKTSVPQIAFLYANDPSRLFKVVNNNTDQLYGLRPDYLGNFEKKENMPKGKSHFNDLWSSFKKNVLGKLPWFIYLYFTMYFCVLLFKYYKSKESSQKIKLEGIAILGIMSIVQIVVSIIGDGTNELEKHLFLFNVIFDSTVFISILWLYQKLANVFKLNYCKV